MTVVLQGVRAEVLQGNVGAFAEERDPSGTEFRVQGQTPAGARSDSLLDGRAVSLNIRGPIQMGSKGEPRVLQILLERLSQEGLDPVPAEGQDERGEDGILLFQGQRLTLQVVSVPYGEELWRDASQGSATTSVPVADAAKWIRDSIVAKVNETSLAERSKTILALDAVNAGVLSAREVADAYLELYGDPHLEFELGSVWLVGPTPSTTRRIGTGRL